MRERGEPKGGGKGVQLGIGFLRPSSFIPPPPHVPLAPHAPQAPTGSTRPSASASAWPRTPSPSSTASRWPSASTGRARRGPSCPACRRCRTSSSSTSRASRSCTRRRTRTRRTSTCWRRCVGGGCGCMCVCGGGGTPGCVGWWGARAGCWLASSCQGPIKRLRHTHSLAAPSPPPLPLGHVLQKEAALRQQGGSDEAIAAEMQPKEDDPQPLTEEELQGACGALTWRCR